LPLLFPLFCLCIWSFFFPFLLSFIFLSWHWTIPHDHIQLANKA
jgi:hypothetical protein